MYDDATAAADGAPLSTAERTALRGFTRASAALDLLGALAQWHAGDQSAETCYLIDLGLAALRGHHRP